MALLKTIEKAKNLNANYLYLYTESTNRVAIQLYKNVGFEYVSNVDEFIQKNKLTWLNFEKGSDIIFRKKL